MLGSRELRAVGLALWQRREAMGEVWAWWVAHGASIPMVCGSLSWGEDGGVGLAVAQGESCLQCPREGC